MQSQCYSDFTVYISVMAVPVKSSIRSAAALRSFALEESSPPVLHHDLLTFPERVQISAELLCEQDMILNRLYLLDYLCVAVRQNKPRIHQRHSEVQQN